MHTVHTRSVFVAAMVLAAGASLCHAQPVDPGFTYQGRLTDNGAAPTGAYDLEFRLFDASTGGAQVGPTVTVNDASVAQGLFSARLNFGAVFGASKRWLSIAVRPGVSTGAYTTLSPRVEMVAAPLATYALGPWQTITDNSAPGNGFYLRSGDNSYIGMDATYGDLHSNGGNDGTFAIVSEGAGSGRFTIVTKNGSGNDTERFEIGNLTGNVAINGSPASVGGPKLSVAGDSGAIGVYGTGSIGVQGSGSGSDTGVEGLTFSGTGIHGAAGGTSIFGFGTAVRGDATGGAGVAGYSNTFIGVYGHSNGPGQPGMLGEAALFDGVKGITHGAGASGVSGFNFGGGSSYGGYFEGGPGTGLYAGSTGNDALLAVTSAPGHAAVSGNSYAATGYGGYFENHAVGGIALKAAGLCQVNVLQILGGSDLAESFDVARLDDQPAIEPGMVVVIDPDHPGDLRLSSEPYDTKVAGVISGANGLAAGMVMKAVGQEHVDGQHPVAMTGRVWCWVDASFGEVRPGDALTTSTVAGFAMRADDHSRASGASVGKAMTGLRGGRGLVLVLVNLN